MLRVPFGGSPGPHRMLARPGRLGSLSFLQRGQESDGTEGSLALSSCGPGSAEHWPGLLLTL